MLLKLRILVNYEGFYKEGNYATPAAINCVIATVITSVVYYNITKHEKGIFYIKNNDDIYLLTIKNIDLEKK